MRVALYARVSTQDQSTEAQLAELRRFAGQRGWIIAAEYKDTVTGSEKRRPSAAPAFKKLMQDARQRKIDGVLVWKLDRFARSVRMLVEALGEFSALGIEFISMTQNIDTTTPSGKLFFYLFAAFAEFERELIAERVRSGIAHRKAKGLPTGRRRDFAAEARICNLKEDGASVRQISRLTGRSRAGVALVLKRAYNQGESQ